MLSGTVGQELLGVLTAGGERLVELLEERRATGQQGGHSPLEGKRAPLSPAGGLGGSCWARGQGVAGQRGAVKVQRGGHGKGCRSADLPQPSVACVRMAEGRWPNPPRAQVQQAQCGRWDGWPEDEGGPWDP